MMRSQNAQFVHNGMDGMITTTMKPNHNRIPSANSTPTMKHHHRIPSTNSTPTLSPTMFLDHIDISLFLLYYTHTGYNQRGNRIQEMKLYASRGTETRAVSTTDSCGLSNYVGSRRSRTPRL